MWRFSQSDGQSVNGGFQTKREATFSAQITSNRTGKSYLISHYVPLTGKWRVMGRVDPQQPAPAH